MLKGVLQVETKGHEVVNSNLYEEIEDNDKGNCIGIMKDIQINAFFFVTFSVSKNTCIKQ